jgi:hypothetical protein
MTVTDIGIYSIEDLEVAQKQRRSDDESGVENFSAYVWEAISRIATLLS